MTNSANTTTLASRSKYIPTELELDRAMCRQSFYFFVQYFWDVVIQEPPVFNFHIKYICRRLQRMAHRVIKRLPSECDMIINIPPGETKSTLASVMFPVWCWTLDPTLQIMSASYAQTLSYALSEKSRDILRHPRFMALFPELRIRQDIDSKTRYQNTAGGERMATSVGGTVTGFHAHIFIVDDPLNPNEAVSEKERDRANRFMTDTLPTRKIDKNVSVTILIMQRLHEQDPTGKMLANPDLAVEHICLPGYESPNIKPGSLKNYYQDGQMNPARLSREAMAKQRAAMGAYNYAGQIGQEPSPADGEIWRREWFKIMPRARILEKYKITERGTEWDLAYSETDKNSASAFIEDCKADQYMAILDMGYRWVEFPELIAWIKSRQEPHYIEAKASGKSAKQTLTRQGIPAIEVKVEGGDKVARTRFATPYAESGLVIIASEIAEQLLDDPQQGILKFPKTGTDINDVVVQGITRLLAKKRPKIKRARTIR